MKITTNEEYHEALKEYDTVKDSFENTPEYERAEELLGVINDWEDEHDIDIMGEGLIDEDEPFDFGGDI